MPLQYLAFLESSFDRQAIIDLNLRTFDDAVKREVFERQGGICPHCVAEHREKTHWEIEEMEADHITPWVEGGKTVAGNCQLLCIEHNRRKSSH